MEDVLRKKAFIDALGIESVLSVLSDFHQGVVVTDKTGVVVFYNRAASRMDEMRADDVLGVKVTELYRVDSGISPTMKALSQGRSEVNVACYYRTHLGRLVNSICNAFPITERGEGQGAICFMWEYRAVQDYTRMASRSTRMVNLQKIPKRVIKDKKSCFANGTRYTFESIIGEAPEFSKTVAYARMASRSPSSIILYGETGTGKELFAQAIHNNGPRSDKPFVAINCAAIPEHLLEGILFGTSKGAFTGAVDKAGIFEQANGGTLLLDEVNSMPIGLQAKLLRTLQERLVRRVGSLEEIPIDLKIISTVNEDLHLACEKGRFRTDLMYRLGVIYLEIPPLRDRRLDMGLLAHYFIHRMNRILNMKVVGVSREVMTLFEGYHWPGNVRELEHTIEGAMSMMQGGVILESHHLVGFRGRASHRGGESISNRVEVVDLPSVGPPVSVENQSWTEIKRLQESDSIQEALEAAGGNAAKAARMLGISPQLMHYRLKKYGICKKDFKKVKP